MRVVGVRGMRIHAAVGLGKLHIAVCPQSRERFRYMTETGHATWRRGPPLWTRDPEHRIIETCIAPLATDGVSVDKIRQPGTAALTLGR